MKNNHASPKAALRHRLNQLPRRLRYGMRAFIHKHTPDYFPISYKLALIITLLISAGMVILGLVIVTNQTQLLRSQINDFGQAVVSQLGESSKELVLSDDILSLMVVISNLGTNESILGAVVYSDNGKILASSGTLPSDNIIRLYARSTQVDEQSYSVEWTASTETGESLDAISFIAPIQFQGIVAGHALVTFSKAALDESLRATISAIVAATLLMILLGIVIAFLMGDRLTRPIHRLMDASKAIGNGQYRTQIKERRNDEIGYLTEAFNNMANGLLEKSQVENAFSRFVSSNVAKQIMANLDEIQLGGKHVHGSVLFADIVGFTSLSEKLSPDEVANILNEYFTYISMASQLYRGTIDKYMGDCAMVVFGVPDEDPEHKFNALACAVMIQKLVARINATRVRDGKTPIHFRIGVNSGTMLAGNMGSNERMQYTVVGETVNLASRLHTFADKDQIVITEHLYNDSDIKWRILARRHESIKLRGIATAVSTYLVNDVTDSYQVTMTAQIDNILSQKVVA
ncbi:MAG: HAMP domain-containing protein [Gammaproteobacteria bacterium]|nr:HAMP domain-containing protein [Gammaproteobacteria bacterium]